MKRERLIHRRFFIISKSHLVVHRPPKVVNTALLPLLDSFSKLTPDVIHVHVHVHTCMDCQYKWVTFYGGKYYH